MGELLCTCAGQASVVDGPGIYVRKFPLNLFTTVLAGRALSSLVLDRLVGDWTVAERQKYFSMAYFNVRLTLTGLHGKGVNAK